MAAVLLTGCGAEQAMKKGDKYYALGEYFDAATQYKKAYAQTPAKERTLRGQRALKMAECYQRINYTQKAIAAYNNAIRYKQADSLTHLRLAQQLMKNGSYKEAVKQYQTVLDSMPGHPLALTGLRSAQQAPGWKKAGSDYTVKRENFFNSRRADYSPMLAGEENNLLFFTSTRNQAKGDEYSGITGTKNADIFFSQKDDKGKWGKPQTIESGLNSELDEGTPSFSADGREMYITQCPVDATYPRYATIAVSKRSDAAWAKPTKLEISRDTLSSFAHPALSPDGEWLYFVSDMAGGHGGKDIWRIHIDGAVLGGVENLGSPINTPGDEMFPAFRPNGDFYFSSDGHPGMGGLDIFIAKRDTLTGHWTVSNLQYPMNSAGDDFGMTFEGPYNRGFFCSNRGDARGWDHIWSFDCPEVVQTVRGWVYEKDGYELPEALVYMVGTDGTNQKLSVRGDGSFTAVVQPYVDYIFLGTCKGYLNHSNSLSVDTSHVSREYTLQFPLASITAPVLIRNVFYEFDSAELTESSTSALDSLVTMLNENSNITIELASHCDSRGSEEYNLRLSARRAQSVVDYLIAHGIAPDRLTPRGYGKTRPKVVRRRQAEQYQYLHEGDTLTVDFIAALNTDEQREVANSLNRRTEFRVLRTTYGLYEPPQPIEPIEPLNP